MNWNRIFSCHIYTILVATQPSVRLVPGAHSFTISSTNDYVQYTPDYPVHGLSVQLSTIMPNPVKCLLICSLLLFIHLYTWNISTPRQIFMKFVTVEYYEYLLNHFNFHFDHTILTTLCEDQYVYILISSITY